MSNPPIVLTELEAKKLVAGLYEIVDGRHGEKLQSAANDLFDLLWMQAVRRYITELSTDIESRELLQKQALAALASIPAEKFETFRLGLLKFLAPEELCPKTCGDERCALGPGHDGPCVTRAGRSFG